jgi:hypothetical protein
MSVHINVTALPNIKVKLVQSKYYHGVHIHLCSTASRLKIYKLNTILNYTICKMTNRYFVYAIWDEMNDSEGADGRRRGP